MKYLKAIVTSILFLVIVGCGTSTPKPVLINGQYCMPYKKKVEISNKGKKVNIHAGETYSCSVIGDNTINVKFHVSEDARIVDTRFFKSGKQVAKATYIQENNIWIEHDNKTGKSEAFGLSEDDQSFFVITFNYKKGTKVKDRRGIWGQCTQTTNNYPRYEYIDDYRPMSDQELNMYNYNQQQKQKHNDKVAKTLDNLNDNMQKQNEQLNNMYQQNLNRNNVYKIKIVE